MNEVQVAWVENENEMQYKGEAERVKDIVKQYMKTWKEKRGFDEDEDL